MKNRMIAQILGVVVVMTTVAAFAQVKVPGTTQARFTDQSTLLAAIKSQQEKIQALVQQLTEAQEQLQIIRANKPVEPEREGFDDDATFEAALREYQAAMTQWQYRMRHVATRVEAIQRKLMEEQRKLAKLQAQQAQETQQAKQTQEARKTQEALKAQEATKEAHNSYARPSTPNTGRSEPSKGAVLPTGGGEPAPTAGDLAAEMPAKATDADSDDQ